MRIFEISLLVFFLCHESTRCDAVEIKTLRLCVTQNTCENCLQASSSCAWCSDWSYSNATIGRPRCNAPEKLKEFGCPSEEIRTTPPGSTEFLENSDFQDMEAGRTPIQLKPQRVKVRIPFHSEITIPIRYRVAKNYPLDLYYLMDLTWSMKDDKDTLVSLGWNMSQTFGKFTSNFRLGFGSYADKPLMPFVFPGHEKNPCKSEHAVCAPLYSYWHHLELTDDIQRFVTEVNNSLVTGNVDNLEGGLDGIAQAIVCTKEIGWGYQARKIILVATDGYLHFAGDGKLGGAVTRQDFQCHLDERAQFSLATKFDYPSLAELSRLLQDHKMNLIFAVTEKRREEYEQTVKLLKEKARVATLTGDSSNILEIIESAYHQITSKVILRDNSSAPLRIEYFSNCSKGDELNTAECGDIEEGKVYDFKVVLSFDECPRDKNLWKQTVVIQDALASEISKIVVDIELLCGCNCMDSKSSHCNHGMNECGLCKCDFGWSGETCDCDRNSPVNNVQQCMGSNSTKICSDRGECVCGKCYCDEGNKGEFCECSACDQIDGIECSNKGTCQCGVCNCIEGWQGNACQCPSTDDSCVAPGSQEVCGGHGYCDCGECRCNETAADGMYYRGTYCESSIGAGGSGLCIFYNPCVNATIEDPKQADDFCQTTVSNTTYNTEIVESVDIENEQHCFVKTVKGKTTCVIHYVYEFQKSNVVTLKIANKVCNTPIHAAVIPSAVIIGTVLIGLFSLLIWKCYISIKDKREYEKFIREREKTVFSLNQNPLFKPAISRFTVPAVYHED